jgi:hypothetical protein
MEQSSQFGSFNTMESSASPGPSPVDRKHEIHKLKFTSAEDFKLIDLVRRFGCGNWEAIAPFMQNRTSRQCRERWTHYLNPFVSHRPWSAAEDELLFRKVAECGRKWTQIVPFFPTRTSVNLKNHWMTLQRRTSRPADEPASAPTTTRPPATFDEFLDNFEPMWNNEVRDWFGFSRSGAIGSD